MERKDIDLTDASNLKGYEYETLMNALHVSVFKCLLDEDFTAIWCNNYFFDSTGYTKEEYIRKYRFSIRSYFSQMAEEYQQIATIVAETYQKGLPGFECVSRMPQKSGSFIWIKVVGTFTKELYDGIPVLYVVYTDITDVIEQQELSKRLEERSKMLRHALDEAEEASHAKSEFLSRMSHDIRTPLNAIIGMTEIADAHLHEPEKIHNCHKKITLSSQHLLGLINDILDMSKIESGKMTLNNTAISLPELLSNVVAMMQPDIKTKKQSFAVYPYDLHYETICSDALRLRQVFLNILSNASKFTPEGGSITFEIKEVGMRFDDTVLVQFSFTDTGIGMRPEFLEHLFDTFTREQDSRVDKTIGSGLGMAITKRIVGILRGEINVSSIPGSGSKFEVTLPLNIASSSLQPQIQRDWKNVSILLVDEDPHVCDYMMAIFENLQVNGTCISDGTAAIEMMKQAQHPFDIVILDWDMKSISGEQIILQVQHELREVSPKFIAAAYDWDDVEKEGVELTISGFFTKPLFPSTVSEGLQHVLHDQSDFLYHTGKKETFDFTGKRFLMAEDNELNREIAIELLSATGAIIDYATDGVQCVNMFKESSIGYYDLILMGIQMPMMNGYLAAKRIRELERRDAKSIQIWAMSADAFVEDVEKAKAFGMNGHFAKPLDFHMVTAEISRMLNQ